MAVDLTTAGTEPAMELEAQAPVQPLQAPAATAGATDAAAQLAMLGSSPGDMMSRFEALSQLFRSEIEGLVGQEHAASKETLEQLRARISTLEGELDGQVLQAQHIATRLHRFVQQRQPACLFRVFGGVEPDVMSVEALGNFVEAFLCANEEQHHPELEAAQGRAQELAQQLASRDAELSTLREELREAQVLKTQEQRELCEFKALREKESELQECQLKLSELQTHHEELQDVQKLVLGRAAQSEASLGEKSRRLMSLMQQVEEQTEQCRLLSNENNTLRLQLGKDSEYLKAMQSPTDPLSYNSKVGALGEELQHEESRMQDSLASAQLKFPGLATDSVHCRGWCGAHIARQCSVYRSFLHLLQDSREDVPSELDVNFVCKAQEVDAAWLQREEEFRQVDVAFQEHERAYTKKWEEKRLELTAERDAKVKQLLEQAERAQTRAEQQLLLQQAKLFGQRLDAQIERAWEEQRKERDVRWAAHNQVKQESRQKFKDESLSVQQQADGVATASERFQDMARARLAGVEDSWGRNVEKASEVSTSALRDGDLAACLKAAGLKEPPAPNAGSMYGGLSVVLQSLEELITLRVKARMQLGEELKEQSLQQLRVCVEKFVQKESLQQRKVSEEEEKAPEYTQAASIRALLRARQHRVVADTVRRQFHDFMLALRVATLAAVLLVPSRAAGQLGLRGAKLDLPPVPQELRAEAAVAATMLAPAVEAIPDSLVHALAVDTDATTDEQLEGRLLYDALMRRLLERALTLLHSQHREELLGLKRANAKEVRSVLQQFCQLEGEAVGQAAASDLEEFRSQTRTKLLSDCEYHICEERRQLSEQVDEDVELYVRKYQRQVAEEELAFVRERRKWLTGRLVVMQGQGASGPGDRAVMQHLRNELRACEATFEQRERELGSSTAAAPTEVSPETSRRQPASQQCVRPPLDSSQSAERAAQPALSRPPNRGASPRPRQVGSILSTGSSGTLPEPVAAVVPPTQHSAEEGERAPSFGGQMLPRPPAEQRHKSPSHGRSQSPKPVSTTAPPLYEWPFETCRPQVKAEPAALKTPRTLSAARIPEGLPPLRPAPPLARAGTMEDGIHGGYARSAGISLGAAPVASSAGKLRSPQDPLHVLPPMPTPRSGRSA